MQALGPHVAPLGVLFWGANASAPGYSAVEPQQWPEAFDSSVFVAEHGSWNRKVGVVWCGGWVGGWVP